ncbi:hypothetical protein VTN77DRAFT_6771 [Rasamsonia byssochlamydoides]|uniref:uncharacterized protein n=1 Tax=Rasamsonia byssochlamydoides TaxID=89139 RepID=UPI003744680C
MRIPLQQLQRLDARQSDGPARHHSRMITIVVVVVTVGVFWTLTAYCYLRRLRIKNYTPKLLPGKFLKQQWKRWSPGKSRQYGQVPSEALNRNEDTTYTGAAPDQQITDSDGPRRVTSIRSIITLPAYSATPKPTEQVIAREGERGGMDIVVEFPETAEEEEMRREEEMESLYQIRLRRRQEIAEREERRRLRREARARGDYALLDQLSRESIAARSQTGTTAAAMLAEHQSRGRERRISAVSYYDLGHVRHDGSRIRAASTDSDQRPLLDCASAIATDATNSIRSQHAISHVSTQTEPDDGDVGASRIPPPAYDQLDWGEAPPYESPTADRGEGAPHLPVIESLPTIRIDMATPLGSAANTPAANSPVDASQTQSNSQSNSSETTPHSPSSHP